MLFATTLSQRVAPWIVDVDIVESRRRHGRDTQRTERPSERMVRRQQVDEGEVEGDGEGIRWMFRSELFRSFPAKVVALGFFPTRSDSPVHIVRSLGRS